MRGNQYLEFDRDASTGQEHRPARRLQPPPEVAYRIDREEESGLGWLFLPIALTVIAAVLAPSISGGAPPAQAEQRTARGSKRAQSPALPRPPRARATSLPSSHQLHIHMPDGRVYTVSGGGGAWFGKLPVDLVLARAEAALFIHDRPEGDPVWQIPEGTTLIAATATYRQPCWRWITTMDAVHTGFVCTEDLPRNTANPALAANPLPTPASDFRRRRKSAPGGQWKDRTEYDLYLAIRAAANPRDKLKLLRQWQRRYPHSDFVGRRQHLLAEALAGR